MPRAPSCPFCESDEVELISQFGSQILTSQWACRACNSYFEAIRAEFDEQRPAPSPQRSSPSK
jgi:transposase-like protein